MSSQQKRGFRLPWAAERSTEDGAAAATLEADPAEPTTPAQIVDEVGGELGEGPFHFADSATPDASTDASPEAPEVPLNTAEAAMIETETATNATLETAPAEHDGWVAEVPGALGCCELDWLPTLLGVAPQAARTVARSAVPAAPDSASILLVGMKFLYLKTSTMGTVTTPLSYLTPDTWPRFIMIVEPGYSARPYY